jgi:two-component system OmpR family response regulator
MRVLVVEDDPELSRQLLKALTDSGYAVDHAADGEEGHYLGDTEPYDAVILDLGLPELDGVTVLKRWRASGRKMPVLILTARGQWGEKVAGFDAGADDYVTKPFDMGELVARCKSLVRRAYDRPSPEIRVGSLVVNTAARRVTCGGKAILLPAMEYRLLEYLALRGGQVVSKEDILDRLYDFESEKFSNVVEVYISSLRRKLSERGPGPVIHTMRGQGYMLEDVSR